MSRSRQNALKHGLRATDDLFLTCLTRYERRMFEQFRRTLHRDYDPQTAQEQLLVDRIAIQHLRKFRLYRIEYRAGNLSIHSPLGKESILPHLDRFSRYEWRIDRQLRLLQDELKNLFSRRGKFPSSSILLNH